MADDATPSKSRVERITTRLRENPVVAVVIVVAGIVVGVASFTDAVTKLTAPFHKDSPTAARTQLGQLGLPFTADAFVAAAGNGDVAAVKLFVAAGMDPNAVAADGMTALESAAYEDRPAALKALLDAHASVLADEQGRSALNSAVAGGHDDALALLLAKKPDQRTLDAAFVAAVRRRPGRPDRNVPAMRTLAAAGADVRRIAPDAFQAAWENADDEAAASVVRVLLELGVVPADLDGTDGETTRKTPLMDAASQDFPTTVAVLLAHDPALEVRFRHPGEDDDGATALMMAAGSGSAASVRALLAKGADPRAKDRHGLTALDYAKRGDPAKLAAVTEALRAKS